MSTETMGSKRVPISRCYCTTMETLNDYRTVIFSILKHE